MLKKDCLPSFGGAHKGYHAGGVKCGLLYRGNADPAGSEGLCSARTMIVPN